MNARHLDGDDREAVVPLGDTRPPTLLPPGWTWTHPAPGGQVTVTNPAPKPRHPAVTGLLLGLGIAAGLALGCGAGLGLLAWLGVW